MKRFFTHFILPGTLFYIINVIFLISLYPKSTDPYLYKLTAEFKGDIIVGSSRASQGINPDYLGRHYINFAFSNLESSFTEDYIDAIIEKFESVKSAKKSIIIEVNPWNLSEGNRTKTTRSLFKTNKYPKFLKTFDYLYKKYSHKDLLRNIILPDTTLKTHKNGWLEVTLNEDSISYNLRREKKLKAYELLAKESEFSEVKLNNFLKLITYAYQNNIPYLVVRLPVTEDFKVLEKRYYSNFDDTIREMLSDSIKYLTISDGELIYTDGHHLKKKSANKTTLYISNYLKNESLN
jgi:hypothetical protein